MLKQFKNWLYNIITSRLIADDFVISLLYGKLQLEKSRLEEIAKKVRAAKIDAEQRKRAEEITAEKKKFQDSCSHLKGGRIKGPMVDYAIMMHSFSDAHVEVRCLICRKIWAGEQLKSPEVQWMIRHTTNTQTTSEIAPKNRVRDRKEPHYIFDRMSDSEYPLGPFEEIRRQVNQWYINKNRKLLNSGDDSGLNSVPQ